MCFCAVCEICHKVVAALWTTKYQSSVAHNLKAGCIINRKGDIAGQWGIIFLVAFCAPEVKIWSLLLKLSGPGIEWPRATGPLQISSTVSVVLCHSFIHPKMYFRLPKSQFLKLINWILDFLDPTLGLLGFWLGWWGSWL